MKSWVTWVLIGANVAMFAVELAYGVDATKPLVADMVKLGADYGPLTLGEHEWWRVLSSMFLHFGVLHIFMNMLCLWQARGVEKIYGHAGFVAIYFVAGILGGVGSLARGGNVVSAGASGAVFGVFGAFGAFLLRARKTSDPAAWSATAQRLGTFIVLNLIIGLQSKGIDVTAHVVGMIAGFFAGLGMPKLKAVPTLAAGVVLAVAGLLALPAPSAPKPVTFNDVIQDFKNVQRECIETATAKIRAQRANEIDRTMLADALEKEVLPPWQAMRRRIEAIPDERIPEALRPLFALLRQYGADRERAWTDLIQINREQPVPSYRDDELQANADAKAIAAELERLTKP